MSSNVSRDNVREIGRISQILQLIMKTGNSYGSQQWFKVHKTRPMIRLDATGDGNLRLTTMSKTMRLVWDLTSERAIALYYIII